jgi:superfamily II DNA or RNA helicase
MSILRDYQTILVDAADEAKAAGEVPLVVSCTGSGKTVMMAENARRILEAGGNVLAVCHRKEILTQIVRSFSDHLGIVPQVITSERTTDLADVTVAMVPTLARRRNCIEPLRGRHLIIDEAHHAIAPSYQKLRDALRPASVTGFTATPVTPTGAGLSKAGFTKLILGPNPRWLMDNGFLCDYKMYGPIAEINTAGMKKRGGDFATNDMEERVVEIHGSILRDWRQYNPESRPTICVGVSVDHAKFLAKLYSDNGVTAESVDGKTPSAERDAIFDRFRSGATRVLCACAVVDEGLDVPEASCLQLLRPTASIRLYRQLVGRVLRPKADGSDAVIIDHGGSWRNLPLPDDEVEWSLTEKVKAKRGDKKVVVREVDTCLVEKKLVVVESKSPLALVNKRLSTEQRKYIAGIRLNKTLNLVNSGVLPKDALRAHMRDAQWLSSQDLERLSKAANLPQFWQETHGWLNAAAIGR